jgi:putative tryptophan/tyrosine transport system substrate-binding protein
MSIFRRPGAAQAPLRAFAARGGLMPHGASIAVGCRLTAIYRGGSRKRAEPAELPVPYPTTLELMIDLNTAKAPGIEMPASQLARAGQVIG